MDELSRILAEQDDTGWSPSRWCAPTTAGNCPAAESPPPVQTEPSLDIVAALIQVADGA